MSNEMISLADALPPTIDDHLSELKKIARSRSEAAGNPETKFGDWSHLNHENLEAENFIERGEVTLTACDVPFCGRCQEGYFFSRPKLSQAFDALECQYCETPRRFIDRLNKLRLPADAVEMSFDRYEYESQHHFNAIKHMRRWIQRDPEIKRPPALFLCGSSGNGKSSALYCFAREAAYRDRYHQIERRRRARYISHSALMSSIRATFSDRNAKDPLKNWLNGVNLLLVDELGGIGGSANRTGWWVDQSTQLLEQIYRLHRSGELAVVFTSNLGPRGLHRAFGENEAVKSRLKYMFQHSTVEMRGRDRRISTDCVGPWSF